MKKINLNTSLSSILMKSRYLLLLLLFFITIYLGYAWDIASLQADLANTVQQESDLKDQVGRVILRQTTIEKDLTHLPILKTQLTTLQKQIITYEQLPELLNTILNIGAANHLYIKSFSPGKEVKVGAYFKVPIKMSAYGDYHQIATFISQVANMKWIVAENNLTISTELKAAAGEKAPTTVNGKQPLNMDMMLDIYYLAPTAPNSAASTPEAKSHVP